VVWGGSGFGRNRADGAAYDPVTDSWRKLSAAPIEGRHWPSTTWTGEELIVFGGYDYRRSFANGAAYDPLGDRWRRLPRPPVKPRFEHVAAWTGSELLVFGGTWEPGHIALGDGAVYNPATTGGSASSRACRELGIDAALERADRARPTDEF
jgi:N-acetylneuraminic acid mutarotase